MERWTKDPDLMSPLAKGTAWHLVLEQHYRTLKERQDAAQAGGYSWLSDKDQTLQACREAVASLIEDQIEPRGAELADLIRWMYQGHLAMWGLDEEWRVLAVEHPAVCRLPTPSGRPSNFQLKIKIDLVVGKRTPSGTKQIWIVDHKCTDDNSELHTRRGIIRIGDVVEGDQVLGSDGNWTRVTMVTRSTPECYRIRLRNGTDLVCSDRHQWPVERTIHVGRYRRELLTTKELLDGLRDGEQYRMLPAPATKMPDHDYSVHPYVLGALLGDGSFRRDQVSITKQHNPTISRVCSRLPHGSKPGRVLAHGGRAPTTYLIGSIVEHIRGMGLAGHNWSTKFIPPEYLLGSFEQRLELLRGLMDTDGSHRKGVPLYQTGSERLAKDVRRLVESLGGVATVWLNKEPKYQGGTGAPNWEVKMRFPRDFPIPYHHEDKAARYKTSHKTLGERLVIESIEPVGPRPCTDLEVSAADSIFAVEGVLTHNSCANLPKDKELDLDDQFGLYTWGMRKLGQKVFGQVHDAARTTRLVGEQKAWDEGVGYTPGEVQALEDRFKRTPMYRTDTELDEIAIEAYLNAKARYDQQRQLSKINRDSPRHTDSQTCRYLCDFTDPCLAGRKGADLREYLSAKGYQQDHTRH